MLGIKILSTCLIALFGTCLLLQAHDEDVELGEIIAITVGLLVITTTIWI